MKSLGPIFRLVFLSCFFYQAACTSSNSESVEDVMDESGDNQISTTVDEVTVDEDIPSPEQVSQEVREAEAEIDEQTDGTLMPDTPPAGDQKEIDSIIQAEEQAQQQLDGNLAVRSAPVASPPLEDQGVAADLATPSLATVAADEASTANPPSPKAMKKKLRNSKRAAAPAEVENGNYKVYVVQPGDTLGRIARLVYGNSQRWSEIMEANGLSASDRIYPGDALKYVPNSESAAYEAKWEGMARSTLVVQKGETLSMIAERLMGHKDYWKLLWRWNESAIADPHSITPGMNINYVSREDLMSFKNGQMGSVEAH